MIKKYENMMLHFQHHFDNIDPYMTGSILQYIATNSGGLEGQLENPQSIEHTHHSAMEQMTKGGMYSKLQQNWLLRFLTFMVQNFPITTPIEQIREPTTLALTNEECFWITNSPAMSIKVDMPQEAVTQALSQFMTGDFSRFQDINAICQISVVQSFESLLANFGVTQTRKSDILQGSLLFQIKQSTGTDYNETLVMPDQRLIELPGLHVMLNKAGIINEEQAKQLQLLTNAMTPFIQDNIIFRLLQLNLITCPDLAPELHKSFHRLLMKKLYQRFGDQAYPKLSFIRRIMIHLMNIQTGLTCSPENC